MYLLMLVGLGSGDVSNLPLTEIIAKLTQLGSAVTTESIF